MRKLMILIALCLPVQGFAEDYYLSAKKHIYAIEYLRPVIKGTNMTTLQLSFFVKVSSQIAEEITRSEIERIVKFFPPASDGLQALASYYPNNDSLGEKIRFSDGSGFLLYSPKTKKIETEKQRYGPGGILGKYSKKK
ncbi:MAG: hypothetical protein JXA73_22970 [Acidobacteria bacterium]|nr:hypothetical protein [Acidobacteriota bacterium]